MPPIRSGSTVRVASTLRPDARSIWSTIWRASSSESSIAVVSSTLELALLARDEPLELARDLARPRRPRPFSTRSSRKLRTSWSAPPATASSAAAFARAVELRVAQDSAQLGHLVDRLRRSRRGRRGPPRRGRPPSRPRTAPARRCGGRRSRHYALPARARRSRGRRSPPRSAGGGRRGRAPCRSPSTVAISVRSATSARICSSARCVSASIWRLRLLEAPLTVGLGLLADALAAASRRPCGASARISSASAAAPGRRACGAPRAGCGPPRGRGRPRRSAARICSRRASIAPWIGPNAYFLSTNERDQEADDRPDHQPRRDLDQRVGGDGQHRLDEDEGEDRAEQAVEHDGLGQCEAEPLDALELAAELGLAGDRLDHRRRRCCRCRRRRRVRRDRRRGEADRLPGLRDVAGGGGEKCRRACAFLLVFRLDRRADVDG